MKKRIMKALSNLLKATQEVCSEYGCSLSWNHKGSTERNFRSRVQTMQNKINQADIDWDDEYETELENNGEDLIDEINEIADDMKIMANPNSWDEVVDDQLEDAEHAVQMFIYYN